MAEAKRDLIKESKELGIIDVRFSGSGPVIKATENLYDSIRESLKLEEVQKFINS
ncbi:MAG TPA: hypothetical protein PK771_05120 [Spirochaetota bacterium]|nr:hypothetical protein [Spirochaetota bacterium]